MTMKQIKGLVTVKTLASRSVWAVLNDGRKRRIGEVGRKWVWILEDGRHKPVDPNDIKEIDGC